MDLATARRLNALNKDFYERNAASFSATRHAAWPGWERCLGLARAKGLIGADGPVHGGIVPDCSGLEDDPAAGRQLGVSDNDENPATDVLHAPSQRACSATKPLRVLDLACGNLRFARFLADELGERPAAYAGIDATPGMVEGESLPASWNVRLEQLDITGALLDGTFRQRLAASSGRGAGLVDLAVCFGFFHHVPTAAARVRLLQALLDQTRPGGLCCVSLWRFMSDEGLAAKAAATTSEALGSLDLAPQDLDPGDCLLGWQGRPGAWRYCHSFSKTEADELVATVSDRADLAGRFLADGRTGALNEYLVFQRR